MTEVIPFDTDYFAFQEGGSKASGFLQGLAVEKEDYLGALNKEQLNILGDELGVEKRSVRPDKGDKYQRKNHSRLAIRDWAFESFENPYQDLKRVIKRLFPDVEPLRPFAGMEMKVSRKNPRVMSRGVLNYVDPTELTENYKDFYIQNEDDPAFKYSNPTTIWTDLTIPEIYDILMVLSPKSFLDEKLKTTGAIMDDALKKEFDLGERLNQKIVAQATGGYYDQRAKQIKAIPRDLKFSPGEKRKIKDKVKQIITNTSVPEKTRDAIINILKSRKYDAFKNPGGIQELDEDKIRANMTKREEKEERKEKREEMLERRAEKEREQEELREARRKAIEKEERRLARRRREEREERLRKKREEEEEIERKYEEDKRRFAEGARLRDERLSKETLEEKQKRLREERAFFEMLDRQAEEEREESERRAIEGERAEKKREKDRLRKQRSRMKAVMKRGRGIPPEKAFFDGAVASYEKKAPNYLDGFQLIMDTPTFDAYLRQSDKTILLTSRGTEITSWGDLKADASLLANNLKNTNRYNQDANLLRRLVARFPSPPYDYSIAGHSLGVAISNQLMRDFPFIKMAVGYNGAFQPADLQQQNPNIKRLYTDKDFLYNLGGRIFRNVRIVPMDEEPSKSFFGKIASFFTPSPLKAHQLSNFKKLYGTGIPKGLNRLATPEEIAKGEFYDYKGRKWYKPISTEDVAKEKERMADVREQMRVEKIAEYYRQFGGIQGFENKTMGRQLGSMVATINATGESDPELYGATIKSLVQYFTQFAYLIPDDSVPPATNINDFYLAFSNINNEALQEKLLGVLEQFYQDGYVGTFWLERRAKKEAERQKAFELWRQQHPFEAFINGVAIGLKSFIEGAFLRPLSTIGASILNALPLPPALGFLREGANAIRNQFQKEAIRNERLSGVADPTTMAITQTTADALNPLSGLSQGLQVGEALSSFLPEQTGQGKIRGIVRKMVDRKKLIDFGEVRWGTLTDLYNRYKRKHPQTSAKTLGEFAHMIVNNPERFSKKATRKAKFYVNVIEPKTKRGKGNGDDDDDDAKPRDIPPKGDDGDDDDDEEAKKLTKSLEKNTRRRAKRALRLLSKAEGKDTDTKYEEAENLRSLSASEREAYFKEEKKKRDADKDVNRYAIALNEMGEMADRAKTGTKSSRLGKDIGKIPPKGYDSDDENYEDARAKLELLRKSRVKKALTSPPAVPQPAPATFTREVAQASSKPPPPTTPKPSKKASSKPPPPTTPKPSKKASSKPPPPTTPKPPKKNGKGITFSRKPSSADVLNIFAKREKLVKEIVKLEGDIKTAQERVETRRFIPDLRRKKQTKVRELETIGKRLFKIDQDFPEYSDLIERGLRREEVGTAGERILEGVSTPTPVEPAPQVPAGVSEDDIPTAEVIPVSYARRPTGGKRKFKSKKAGFIASVMTCKNPPARPKFDISKMKEVNDGTRQTNERLVSGKYQWDCPEPINLEEQWSQYLDSLPTARARATARQRLRYWTAGVERDPVSREEALRRAMKLIKD